MKKINATKGFSLIEVLISLAILLLILLGFDAMQISALRENRQAYHLSVAQNQLKSLAEQLRVFNPNVDLNQPIADWNQQNSIMLPLGKGYVSGNFPHYELTIFWGAKTNKRSCDKNQLGKIQCLSEQVCI